MTTPPVDHHTLPYRIAVLCYLYDHRDRVLLLHRRQDPNCGMYSPVGGKLEVTRGESPHRCAVREIREETGINLPDDLVRLTGIVSEAAYECENHWLIFLFEVMRPVAHHEITRMDFDEGTLQWVDKNDVPNLPIPLTDRQIMWPLTQQHRGGFFVVHIECSIEPLRWKLHESVKPQQPNTHTPRRAGP